MKPRTFRRVVLLGSLGGIVLVLAFGYFVFRPWQNERQREAMREQGLAAYDAGDYLLAERLLGRYKNSTDDPSAEIFLKHARAREICEVTDGGHIAVAVDSYREYLRRVPDDVDAKMSLLPLMNDRQMFIEAESLANELINEHGVTDIEVLEELLLAMNLLERDEELIEPVLRAMYDHPDAQFNHVRDYLSYLSATGRGDESDELLDARAEANPDSIDVNILLLYRQALNEELDNQTARDEFSSLIGLDPSTLEWHDDAPELSASAAWFVSKVLNAIGEPVLSTLTQARVAAQTGDLVNSVWAARRLYWASFDDRLNELRVETDNGELDPDVLGYQYLSAVRSGDEEGAASLEQQLRENKYDRRAPAWVAYIDGVRASEESDFVETRLQLNNAIEWYPAEPMFRLRMGDQHMSEQRFQEAIQEWEIANQIVNGNTNAQNRFENKVWADALIRIINAYSDQNRLVEASEYIDQLEWVGLFDFSIRAVVFNYKVLLAQRGEMPYTMGQEFVAKWIDEREGFNPRERFLFSPSVATIFASLGETEFAREEVRFGLDHADDDEISMRVKQDLLTIDDIYRLGIADSKGLDTSTVAGRSTTAALRDATRLYEQTNNLQAGIDVIERARDNASSDDRASWDLVLIGFVDEYDPDRAVPMWNALLEESPNDIALLYKVIESRAIGRDLEQVDQLIERVVAITAAEGKTLPPRLRLARANAMVSDPEQITRTNRENALAIVRSVVAGDANYIKARNMLGRLLALPPSPGVPESERYTPDYAGAIEQYRTLARQIQGRRAYVYLIESFDLAFRRLDDRALARAILEEYLVRFGDDPSALPDAAIRFENLGDDEQAAALYEEIIEKSAAPAAMLSLAELRLKQGESGQARRLLQQASEEIELNAPNVLNLAGLYMRTGNQPEAELIAGSGERYGLSPAESRLVHAQFAELYLSPERELEILQSAIDTSPDSVIAWKQIIRRNIELGNLEQASELYAQAIQAVEEDVELQRLGVLTRGAPQTAEEMLNLPGVKDSPMQRRAIERVVAYDNLPASTNAQTRAEMLRELIEEFPQVPVVQSFAVDRLRVLQTDPGVIAQIADAALRNVPSDTGIMQIAGEAYLRSNQPDKAIQVVDLWRTNSLETTIIANAIRARALIQSDELEKAQSELEPFVEQAFRDSDQAISLEVLDAFSYIRLSLGEDPAVTADRLLPLIQENRDARTRIWLNLASSVVRDPDAAAEWIETAARYSDEQDQLWIANSWVRLAQAHGSRAAEFAQNALAILQPLMTGQDDEAVQAYRVAASAHLAIARSTDDGSERTESYTRAVDRAVDAVDANPENILALLEAARYANEGDLHERTIELYQRVLDLNIGNDALNAMASNNLAMTMVRAERASANRDRVTELVQTSTRLQPNVGSYWGTRGWVELKLDLLSDARNSFNETIRLSPESAEGWVGLLIVTRKLGDEYAQESERAYERVRSIAESDGLGDELIRLLQEHGIQDWS